MTRLILRPAKLNELPRILYITKLAYKVPNRKNTLVTKSHEPKDIKDLLLKKQLFIIAAIFDNKIVGAVRYAFDNKNNLCFSRLAVLKTFRKKGIGALLINEIEKIARKKGSKKILLDCIREKKLPEYYKKFGFKVDKVKKHLNYHEVYMSKKINNSKQAI